MTQPIDVNCRMVPSGWSCDVVVGSDAGATRHQVQVDQDVLERLAPGHYDPDRLVMASFEYLLAREPRESILPRFELPVIERYFPGYERAMGRQMAD